MTEKLKTLAERIEHVGRALYGRFWTVKMAAGLGISGSQLFEYRRHFGGKTDRARDLDDEFVALIEREQALSQERAAGLTVLQIEIEIERITGIARKRSKREQEAEHVA